MRCSGGPEDRVDEVQGELRPTGGRLEDTVASAGGRARVVSAVRRTCTAAARPEWPDPACRRSWLNSSSESAKSRAGGSRS